MTHDDSDCLTRLANGTSCNPRASLRRTRPSSSSTTPGTQTPTRGPPPRTPRRWGRRRRACTRLRSRLPISWAQSVSVVGTTLLGHWAFQGGDDAPPTICNNRGDAVGTDVDPYGDDALLAVERSARSAGDPMFSLFSGAGRRAHGTTTPRNGVIDVDDSSKVCIAMYRSREANTSTTELC